MFLYLSKLLPLFVYPLGLACTLLIGALIVRRRPRWTTLLIVATLALLWLSGNRLISMAVVRSLEWQYLPPTTLPKADVIVVLGGGTRPLSYPRPTHEVNEAGDRLLYAASLYQQGVAPHVLLSGGTVGVDGPALMQEAESMGTLLATMGVPAEAQWLETTSRNTYENAVETKKVLDAQGIERIVLVTSAMHMPRSVAIFEKQGFTVIPAPTDYVVTQADWDYYFAPNPAIQVFNLLPGVEAMDRLVRTVKEYLGMEVYRWRGWL
jgi:uncharacterized SAM-binding protein YcdF (DUF218 family)